MARLEKRRMTESANNPSTTTTTTTTTNRQPPSTLIVNGLTTSHPTHEIENLLFKQEQDPNPQFSVTLPENILLHHPITHFSSPTSNKRPRSLDDHSGQIINGPLSPNKKSRIELIDGTKLTATTHSSSGKSNKKNRNKSQQQQQPSQPQTIIKTAASGIFPQQTLALQHIDESSDDVS